MAENRRVSGAHDERDIEAPRAAGARPAEDELQGPDASETLQDITGIPKGEAIAEAKASPADKEDRAGSDLSTPPEQPENDKHEAEANRGQRTDKVEDAEPLATFSAAAVKQSTDGMTRFEVDKSAFEEQSGMKLDREKVYAFEVEISGVGSSRKIYDGSSETDRLAFFAPKEKSESIPVGERHDLRIYSVREVSRTNESLGTFFATAYAVSGREGREDSVRLDVPKATFEKRTGFHFEDGMTYEAKGKIDGEHDFKVTHTGSRENQHVVISFFGEEAKRIKLGMEHTVTVESIEEKRTLTVSGEGPNTRLTLQKRMLESFGVDVDSTKKADEGDRIVKVTLRNLSSADKSEKAVYAKLQPSEGTLPLSIHNVGAKRGDKVEVTGASKHTVKDFVDDFDKRKGEELRNVRLSLEGEKLYLEVDGRRFEAKGYQQDASRLRRYLKVEVEPFQRDFRFWDDGEKITAKFGDSWTIQSFTANEKGLSIRYQMGSRAIIGSFLSPSDKTVLDEGILRTDGISAEVKMISELGLIERSHTFENSVSLHNYIYTRLTQATSISESKYLEERGDLGEDLSIGVLTKFSLVEVERHPFSANPGRGSHKPGTDVLMRNTKGELVLFELKWHRNPDAALGRGHRELRERKSKEKEYKGERISGAYIAVLDYKMKSRQGGLRVERDW